MEYEFADCTMNYIGTKQSALCDNGYMYEQKHIEQPKKTKIFTYNKTNQQVNQFEKPCTTDENCLISRNFNKTATTKGSVFWIFTSETCFETQS